MTGTGRLTATLRGRTRRVVYGEPSPEEIGAELRVMTEVDLAHVVMLVERGLMPRGAGARLLHHIGELRRQRFQPLHQVAMPRGLYLAYEDHLVATLGPDVGGRLHVGRSRNDLKATMTAVVLRERLLQLLSELLRLQAVLLARARAHRGAVMPLYTHYQAAMPGTFGYYLLGVAVALGRDIAAARHAGEGLRRCPLGAGGAAGTDLPIDPSRTAVLLGFDAGPGHALDAVASRDVALRVLAAASTAAVTISRLATDLQLWSTAEFSFVDFPDHLVGGSSAMPQKRNAFLLEHVKAKAAAAVGAWTAAASATRATPFTNSIEVGTEAVAAVWPGLQAVLDATLLAQVLVSDAHPRLRVMRQRAAQGFVTATLLANRLVRLDVPFRTAHRVVGAAVRRAVERRATALAPDDLLLAGLDLPAGVEPDELAGADLDAVVRDLRAGGGPGAFDDAFEATRAELWEHARWARALRLKVRAAQHGLLVAAQHITGENATIEADT